MFERISNSFALARSSWEVLKRDKKLALFPVVSGLGCLIVLASFGIPVAVLLAQAGVLDNRNAQTPIWVYPVGFAFYFCNYFVITFCNAALVSCALMRFNGEETTLGDGFRAAGSRLPQIFAWSLVSATVGLLLQLIENANEKIGSFVRAILGAAWTVITYFVVPVLVVEKIGPFQAIGRSLALLKKTWGEALIGHWGLGFFIFLLALPGVALFVIGIIACTAVAPLGIALIGLAVLYFLGIAAISSALNTIYLSALYQYAAFEAIPSGFDESAMKGAFRSKK